MKRRRSALSESAGLFSTTELTPVPDQQQSIPTHKGRSYAFKGMAQMYEHGIQRLRTATVRTFSHHKSAADASMELKNTSLFGAPQYLQVSNLLGTVRSVCAAGQTWAYGQPLSAEDESNILSLVGDLVAAYPNSGGEPTNAEILQPSATGPAAQLSDGLRYFDPARNVVIPTLAPITTLVDHETQTTQIHMHHTAALLADTVSPQIHRLLGPLARIPLDDPIAMTGSTAPPPTTLLVATPARRRLRTRVTDQSLDDAAARARFLVRCAYTPVAGAASASASAAGAAPPSDELALRVGDVVAVERVGSDAWADGCNYSLGGDCGVREGLRGRFPLFVVEVGEALLSSASAAGLRAPDKRTGTKYGTAPDV
ncbi:hypothetical protein HDU84_001421 [Entophlyctis sp. JEL0112]|nr:hypothetical protein HDU84_001421 [Entophlyctis sp. JEL0112]